MSIWLPMSEAPKDGTPILAVCKHPTKSPTCEEEQLYFALTEHWGHVFDGPNVIQWGGAWDDGEDGSMPDWWYLADGLDETAAWPTMWLPIPAEGVFMDSGWPDALEECSVHFSEPVTLAERLSHAINCTSSENVSDTPDFILAEYILVCLKAFDGAVNRREEWYGRKPSPADTANAADWPSDFPDPEELLP